MNIDWEETVTQDKGSTILGDKVTMYLHPCVYMSCLVSLRYNIVVTLH